MLKRDTFVLIIATVCGVFAFFLIMNFLKEAGSAKKTIVIAIRDIEADTLLSNEDLAYSEPLAGLNTKDYYLQKDDVVDKILMTDIIKGKGIKRSDTKKREPIVQVIKEEEPKKIKDPVLPMPKGKTGVMVENENISNFPPNVEVGKYVELIGWKTNEKTNKRSMESLSPGAQVVSMERNDDNSIKNLTIAVESENLEDVFKALAAGKLNMAVGSGAPPELPPSNKYQTLEIIRGIKPSNKIRFKKNEDGVIDESE